MRGLVNRKSNVWAKMSVMIHCMFLSAGLSAQALETRVELPDGEMTFGQIFERIEGQSDILFGYATKDIDLTRTAVLMQGIYMVGPLLDWLFRDLPLKYSVTGKHIIIARGDEEDTAAYVPYEKYKVKLPGVSVKTNLLYDATSTINLGMEVGLAPKWSIDVSANYNMWKFGNGARLRHWGIQPEIRWWTCERFDGWFIGAHGHYAKYNVGGFSSSLFSENMRKRRYEGYLYGGGVSAGYSWILKKRWSLEAALGLGYARLVYDKFPCGNCGTSMLSSSRDYFGPTKVGLSLVYMIK